MSTIALTTMFTPPAGCSATTLTDVAASGYIINFLVVCGTDTYGYSCSPTGYGSVVWFSLGLCPSGWTFAKGSSSADVFFPQLTAGEKGGVCCPPAYAPSSSFVGDGCASLWTKTYILATVVSDDIQRQTHVTLKTTLDGRSIVYQDSVPIRWKDSDFSGLLSPSGPGVVVAAVTASDSASSGTTQSAISSGVVTQTIPSSTPTSGTQPTAPEAITSATSTGGSGGLSTGVKAGIGVGAAICILVLLASLLILRYRRRNSRHEAMIPEQPELQGNEIKELEGTGIQVRDKLSYREMRSGSLRELRVLNHGGMDNILKVVKYLKSLN